MLPSLLWRNGYWRRDRSMRARQRRDDLSMLITSAKLRRNSVCPDFLSSCHPGYSCHNLKSKQAFRCLSEPPLLGFLTTSVGISTTGGGQFPTLSTSSKWGDIEVRATSCTVPPLAHPFPIQNRKFLPFIK